MKEQTKLTVFTSAAMFVLASIMTGLSATLVPIAAEFGIPATRAGILYSVHFSGFMVFVVLSLTVRGLRPRLLLLTVIAAAYAVALGVAGSASAVWLVFPALFVAGGCGGTLEAQATTVQVMTAESERHAGRTVSITQAGFAVGALLAPIYLSRDLPAGWRGLFFAVAAVAAGAFLLSLRIRTSGFDHRETPSGNVDRRALVRVALALGFYVGAEVTLFGWVPTVMEYFRGIPAERARLAPSVFWIGMLAGRVLIARVSHSLSPRLLLAISTGSAFVGSLAIPFVTSEWLLWVVFAITALGAAGIWPLIVSTSGSVGSDLATPITIAAGGLGAAVFPYLAGRTAEVLPGNYIPLLAAPLFALVLILTIKPNKA